MRFSLTFDDGSSPELGDDAQVLELFDVTANGSLRLAGSLRQGAVARPANSLDVRVVREDQGDEFDWWSCVQVVQDEADVLNAHL